MVGGWGEGWGEVVAAGEEVFECFFGGGKEDLDVGGAEEEEAAGGGGGGGRDVNAEDVGGVVEGDAGGEADGQSAVEADEGDFVPHAG